MKYPLAKQGVFRTIQGEGELLGLPMVFVRLAGCPVGCPQCDTDYATHERIEAVEIAERVLACRGNAEWIWITGGEPAAYQLWELNQALRLCGRVALATSGHRALGTGRWNFISVSPHGTPAELIVVRANQINLVPGLNGLQLADWGEFDFSGFGAKYVTPMDGNHESLQSCLTWLAFRSVWRLGVQAHKQWGIA